MADYYVTPAGAGAKDGAAWASAFGEAEFETEIEGGADAGDIYYIAGGDYTLDSAYATATQDGTGTAPITWVGVKTGTTNEPPIITDWAMGKINGAADDRPVFICAANAITFGDCYKIMNITFTGTSATMITTATDTTFFNCKIVQQSSTANRVGISGATAPLYVMCEFCGLVGTGVVGRGFSYSSACNFYFCWFHDLNTGIYAPTSGQNARVIFCVFEDCTLYGAYGTAMRWQILNCTFNDCGAAIYTTSTVMLVMNNILEGCTASGISSDSQDDGGIYWNNHGDNARNTDMWLNVATTLPHGDLNNTTGDPVFDADGNLSLGAASPCIDAGKSAILGT